MGAPEQELTLLNRIKSVLNDRDESKDAVIDEILDTINGKKLGDFRNGSHDQLIRALEFISEIVPRYVELFFDPRSFPVTLGQRQKNVAIELDRWFSEILWKLVEIRETPALFENGVKISDPFLDEPILFFKQEAREKAFPKNKRGELTHPEWLTERFQEKLLGKGIRLDQESSKPQRFEYGP